MNLSWANQFAKTALKSAQQKIDSVLDIQTEEERDCTSESVILDDPLLTPVPSADEPATFTDDSPLDTEQDRSDWTSFLGTESQVVVDSEPNPIRDTGATVPPSLLDHSPSSNSSASPELNVTTKSSDEEQYAAVDLNDEIIESKCDNPNRIVEQPSSIVGSDLVRSRRSSHDHDDTLTVASSDIEVIKNSDTWSIASGKVTLDHLPTRLVPKSEHLDALQAQIQQGEKRRVELKSSNDALQKNNSHLQQRIVVLNQQQAVLKKEIDDKASELQDLLAEGKKISDYSAKQSKEIRRLKNELSDLDKIKAERKRLKDEKVEAEEKLQLQKEEIVSLKAIIKTLETDSEQMKKEYSITTASTEAVQKHIEELSSRISELESQLSEKNSLISEITEDKKVVEVQLEKMQATQWAEKIAGERANETAVSAGHELTEARCQIERLTAQLHRAEQRIEDLLSEHRNYAESLSQANGPLLEEISDLKLDLLKEQNIAEEADRRSRQFKKQLEDLSCEKIALEARIAENLNDHHRQISDLSRRNGELEKELARSEREKSAELDRQNALRISDRSRISVLEEEISSLTGEALSVRRTLKEFKDENDTLKKEIAEHKRQHEQRSCATPHSNQAQSDVVQEDISKESTSEAQSVELMAPLAYTISSPYPQSAAQVELESLSTQYDSSMKRIAFLEKEASRCKLLEKHIKDLRMEKKELTLKYDQLLELDGERLEKIEELTHDVIDLRNLLKEQVLAFAEANSRE